MDNRAPAYQEYARDIYMKCASLTLEQRGAFRTLRDYQWIEGPLVDDVVQLARVVGVPAKDFRGIWTTIARFFPPCPDMPGHVADPELEAKRRAGEAYRRQAAESGRRGAGQRWGKDGVPHETGKGTPPAPQPETNGTAPAPAPAPATSPASVLRTGAPPRRGHADEPWNTVAAKHLRELCYPPDGQPPDGFDIGRDLRWWEQKLTAGESPARIVAALRGAPIEAPALVGGGVKWNPAKVFSKGGPWVNLYERAITADGKSGRVRRLAEPLAEYLRADGA